ncbi:MAG: hypothetical protein R3E89_17695, partial [Thiolinea sp.]
IPDTELPAAETTGVGMGNLLKGTAAAAGAGLAAKFGSDWVAREGEEDATATTRTAAAEEVRLSVPELGGSAVAPNVDAGDDEVPELDLPPIPGLDMNDFGPQSELETETLSVEDIPDIAAETPTAPMIKLPAVDKDRMVSTTAEHVDAADDTVEHVVSTTVEHIDAADDTVEHVVSTTTTVEPENEASVAVDDVAGEREIAPGPAIEVYTDADQVDSVGTATDETAGDDTLADTTTTTSSTRVGGAAAAGLAAAGAGMFSEDADTTATPETDDAMRQIMSRIRQTLQDARQGGYPGRRIWTLGELCFDCGQLEAEQQLVLEPRH